MFLSDLRSTCLCRMGVRRGQGDLLLGRLHHLPLLPPLRNVARRLSFRILNTFQQPSVLYNYFKNYLHFFHVLL
jgi:hypothetical protein